MNDTLEQMIQRHEGLSLSPYIDTCGVQTIGFGHNIHKPITRKAAEQIFQDDLADAKNDCLHAFPWFAELDEKRQWVVLDMCFNLGLPKLLKFTQFLKAMELGDYETAADEMTNSLWAKQTKRRVLELVALLRGESET